jgi:hypothetical protein
MIPFGRVIDHRLIHKQEREVLPAPAGACYHSVRALGLVMSMSEGLGRPCCRRAGH